MPIKKITDMAIRLLAAIAKPETGEDWISLENATKQSGVSIGSAQIITSALREKDILKSMRGPNGGYRLARPAEAITIREIIEATDGLHLAFDEKRRAAQHGGVDALFDELARRLLETTEQKSLADLIPTFPRPHRMAHRCQECGNSGENSPSSP